MRIFAVLILLLIGFTSNSFSQNYLVKYDSVKTFTLKAGKEYSFKLASSGLLVSDKLVALKTDTLVFEDQTYHFTEISEIKNPKRKGAIAAIMYPLTIGSCVAVSTIPITYIKGYFLADTDLMFRTVGVFIVETMVFSFSRSYLSKNPSWVAIGKEKSLKFSTN
ncbi:MAG: hypothetical protein JXQ87_13410 [Bacteroidia bacterium]